MANFLDWNHHVDHFLKTISKILNSVQTVISSTKYLKCLVSSHIKYCNIVWGFTKTKISNGFMNYINLAFT